MRSYHGNLALGYDKTDAASRNAVESIVVHGRSRGVFHIPGVYSSMNDIPYAVRIQAIDQSQTAWVPKQMGTHNTFVVRYEVFNYGDSPIFADLVPTA